MSGTFSSARGSVQVKPPLAIAAALAEPAHALDTCRDIYVSLAGLDGMEGHPGALQGRGAVAGDGGAGKGVVAEHHGDNPGHVVALLAAGQAAAKDEIADLRRIDLRHLSERRREQLRGQVIRPDTGE